jgi:phage gp29-like protein
MTPETLSSILSAAARGKTRDQCDLFDRLIWFDGHIRANYETRLAMVGGSPWEITPGRSTDPTRAERAADGAAFCEEVLSSLDTFDQAVMDWLDGIGVGFAVTEIQWEDDLPVQFDWLHPRRFCFGTGWEIRLEDFGDRYVSGGEALSDYPDKFVVHAPRVRGNYPGLNGCLRSCAWIYLFRRWVTQFWVRGVEKFAWPTLVGKVSRNAPLEARQAMRDVLRDAANDHYMVTETDQAVELLETLAKDSGSFAALDEALKAEASKAILGSTDQTEPVKVGAWKAVESRKGTTVDSRVALDERQLRATVRAQLLEPMLRHNARRFGGVVPAIPEIRWRVAGTRVPISQSAIAAGAVTLDEIREREGLPPLPNSEESEGALADR